LNKSYTYILLSILLLSLLAINGLNIATNIIEASTEKIYVAFVWHYHQPWYYSADESHLVLPWVRMHSVGNYYKMAYILSKYPDVKATFTFSGSLLEQIVDMAENDRMDKRQIISWKIANGTVTKDDVFEMLKIPGGFFDVNWARIVNRSPRYSSLRDLVQRLISDCGRTAKTELEYKECIVNGFTQGNLLGQNTIDLAVLFNLMWIDPQVAREKYPEIYSMQEKAYTQSNPGFTIEDLVKVLRVHEDIVKNIIPIYRELASKGQVEVIPVPYSHPLAPLIVDFGFSDDLEVHVKFSIELFKSKLGVTPRGVWPAEQAVNEYVVRAFRRAGITWTITDESILGATGVNTNDIENLGIPWYIDFPEGRIYIVFRDTEVSNLISFQYSNWDQDQAVNDLVDKILGIAKGAKGPRLVVIALDGENPWENYPEFGDVFLNKLYSRLSELQKQGVIETITPGEFISRFPNVARELPLNQYKYLDLQGRDIADLPENSYGDAYSDLPRKTIQARLPEGSWGGGEVAIWIGHRQENTAWMWLVKTREDVFKKLGVSSFNELYDKHPVIAKYIMKAEASDWWWWYGGDGGGSPATFDPLFKAYLARAYELAGLTPPEYLLVSAYPDGTPIGTLNQNAPRLLDKQLTVDGSLEATWSTLVNEGKALQVVVGEKLPVVYVALDSNNLYFAFNLKTTTLSNTKIAVYFATPVVKMTPYNPEYNVYPRNSRIDLGIHLARELLIDPVAKTAVISKAEGRGGWIKTRDVKELAIGGSSGNYIIELSTSIKDLDLATGQLAFFAIVLYSSNELVEYSSRLGLAYMLSIPIPPPETTSGGVLMDIADPEGDDDGAGGYGYPSNPAFQPGVFDLLRFTMIDQGDKLMLRFVFKNLGGNPWGGPNGWSLQQIHVYVKTTMPATGKKDTFGLGVEIAHGWHMALLVAPGWGTDPLPQGEKTALYYYDKDTPLVQNGVLKAYADQSTNSIIVEVSKQVLYDVENAGKWVIAVLVTSHDGYGENKIRSFTIGGGEWQVNVPAEYSLAILNGVLPKVLDVLAPTKQDQYSMLRSFNIDEKTPAQIYGVVYMITIYKPVLTPVITTTITSTTTITETIESTKTVTETTSQPVTIREVDTATSIGIGIVMLIIGFSTGYLFVKKASRK